MLTKARALHALGRTEAHGLVEQVIARHGHAVAFEIAQSYAWFGEGDRALKWLERAYAQREPSLRWMKNDPYFRALHGAPRFKALLEQMRLPRD
jgi:hypothetical protein